MSQKHIIWTFHFHYLLILSLSQNFSLSSYLSQRGLNIRSEPIVIHFFVFLWASSRMWWSLWRNVNNGNKRSNWWWFFWFFSFRSVFTCWVVITTAKWKFQVALDFVHVIVSFDCVFLTFSNLYVAKNQPLQNGLALEKLNSIWTSVKV